MNNHTVSAAVIATELIQRATSLTEVTECAKALTGLINACSPAQKPEQTQELTQTIEPKLASVGITGNSAKKRAKNTQANLSEVKQLTLWDTMPLLESNEPHSELSGA